MSDIENLWTNHIGAPLSTNFLRGLSGIYDRQILFGPFWNYNSNFFNENTVQRGRVFNFLKEIWLQAFQGVCKQLVEVEVTLLWNQNNQRITFGKMVSLKAWTLLPFKPYFQYSSQENDSPRIPVGFRPVRQDNLNAIIVWTVIIRLIIGQIFIILITSRS